MLHCGGDSLEAWEAFDPILSQRIQEEGDGSRVGLMCAQGTSSDHRAWMHNARHEPWWRLTDMTVYGSRRKGSLEIARGYCTSSGQEP